MDTVRESGSIPKCIEFREVIPGKDNIRQSHQQDEKVHNLAEKSAKLWTLLQLRKDAELPIVKLGELNQAQTNQNDLSH